MTLSTFKTAVKANDLKLIADAHRAFQAQGLTDRQIYRLALAAEPDLSFEEWVSRVQIALLRHPGR